jgi:hypothetical protein
VAAALLQETVTEWRRRLWWETESKWRRWWMRRLWRATLWKERRSGHIVVLLHTPELHALTTSSNVTLLAMFLNRLRFPIVGGVPLDTLRRVLRELHVTSPPSGSVALMVFDLAC